MNIIAGKYRGMSLFTPHGNRIRPTTGKVREAIFNIIGPSIWEKDVIDLFCGSGALGMEALSRGAKTVTFVDSAPKSLQLAQKNIAKINELPPETTQTLRMDALHFLEKYAEIQSIDVLLADPPYNFPHMQRLIPAIFRHSLLRDGGIAIIEHSSRESYLLDIAQPELHFEQRRYGNSALTIIKKAL